MSTTSTDRLHDLAHEVAQRSSLDVFRSDAARAAAEQCTRKMRTLPPGTMPTEPTDDRPRIRLPG